MKQFLPEPVRQLVAPSPAWFVLLAAFANSSRLAANPILTAALAICALLWLAIVKDLHPSLECWPLWATFFVFLLSSGVSWLTEGGPFLTSYFSLAASWLLFAISVLWTSNRVRQLQAALVGFVAGLLLTWGIGIFEVVTGKKVSLWIHPDSATSQRVLEDRFLAQSVFTNTNDFAVALAMLSAILLARMIFDSGSAAWQTTRIVVAASSALMLMKTSSRGATLALGLTPILVLVLFIRQSPGFKLRLRWVFIGVSALLLSGVIIWRSSWVQDTSTASRENILTNVLTMLGAEPERALFGFGSLDNYSNSAVNRFGQILMDPHNLGLELIIAYGSIGFVATLGLFLYLIVKTVVKGQLPRYSLAFASAAVALVVPVVGVVPSAFLPYPYLWMGLIMLAGWSWVSESRPDLSLPRLR